MPVEIRELVVRTTIDNSVESKIDNKHQNIDLERLIPELKEEIIDECVNRIMEQIRSMNER